ncbi:hypothetical protein J5N97_009701 [Dioscorea zingiberensis]|uniref:Aminotransferase-like plant mobile domain-containing protein n=1 Tax=Dioscorea zingiberensis TaxID=325984 RepID=A0A9D5CXN4_9LILI|nr:hypothetical protein J5N97_009701 [Dioscorea zingiberensis]
MIRSFSEITTAVAMEFPTIPPPGPDNNSILTDQSKHRAEQIYRGDIWIWEYFPTLASVRWVTDDVLPLDYPYGSRYGRYRPMASIFRLRESELQRWAARHTTIVHQARGLARRREDSLRSYISWYWSITRQYVSTPTMLAHTFTYTPRGFVETAMLNFLVNTSEMASLADSDVLLDAVVYRDRLREIQSYCQQVINDLPLREPPNVYRVDPTSLGHVPRRGGRLRQISRQHDYEVGPSTLVNDISGSGDVDPTSQLTQLEERGVTDT